MHTRPRFLSHFLLICSRITARRIVLSLLLFCCAWSLERDVKAAPTAAIPADSGVLYVLNDCGGCENQIFGFTVDETTGLLTPLGLPVSTGGTGLASSLAYQLLAIDHKNLRLFALNARSNTVSAFRINPETGALSAMSISPIALPPTLNDTLDHWVTIAVHTSGADSLLVIGDILGPDVDNRGRLASFKVTETSADSAPSSPRSTRGASPLSTAFTTDGRFVYSGGGGTTQIAGFSVDPTNAELTLLNGDRAFNIPIGNAPSSYAIDSAGRLFLVNRPLHIPLVFSIDSSGTPQHLFTSVFSSGATDASAGVLHPNGFYMVSERAGNDVGVYQITGSGNTTRLTKVAGSPFASDPGTSQVGVHVLALSQNGNFLFAAKNNKHSLTTFTVGSGGVLAINTTQPDNTICTQAIASCTRGGLNGIAYLGPRTTTMTIDAPDITCGDDAVVVVNVNAPAGNPTGDVQLTVDGGPPMTRPLVGDPSATFTIPAQTLSAGNHSVVATYDAQNGYGASSANTTFVVNIIPTTTTIIDASAIIFGQNGSVIVQVTSLFGTPTGEVTLTVDGVEQLPQTLSGGLAIFPIPGLNAGTHSLIATFSPQACLGTSSDTGTLVVKLAPTRTFVTAPPIIAGLDASAIVRVTSSFAVPVGEVKFKIDGVAVPARPLSNGSAIFVIRAPAVGIHILVANFPAQGNFAASSGDAKLIVKEAKPTITKIIAPPVTLGFPSIGQTAPVTVTVRSANFPFTFPSGKVSLKLDNGTAMTKNLSGGKAIFNLVVPAVGIHSLKAAFLGQPGVFAPSSDTDILIVKGTGRPSETRTTIQASAITVGQNGSVIVRVTSAIGTPAGNVSLTVDNGAMTTKVISGGSATFIVNRPTAGNHSLLATFTGTSDFVASKAIGILVVKPPVVKP